MFCSTISTFFFVSWLLHFFVNNAYGHFTIQFPARSRELQALPSSNEHFYPIAGGNTLRTVKNCLNYPKGEIAMGQAGQKLTLKYLIGNGASHVGMCTAELYNADTSEKIQDIGSINNCISQFQAMDVTLPQRACPRCVIRVKVLATHIPWAPEQYDSCMDISITGPTNPYAYASETQSSPANPVTPYRYRPGNSKSAPSTPPTPTSTPNNNDNTCDDTQQYRCEQDGEMLYQCVYKSWLRRPLAAGTLCRLDARGNLQIINKSLKLS